MVDWQIEESREKHKYNKQKKMLSELDGIVMPTAEIGEKCMY